MQVGNANLSLRCWRKRAGVCLILAWFVAVLSCLGPSRALAQGVGEKVGTAASEAAAKVQEAGESTASKLEQLWRRIDEGRLKNRSLDEIIAWIIMGMVVGGFLGQVTGLRRWVALGWGLVGAFLGGIAAHVTQLDLGMGPVLIRYEDLLLSLAGGVALLLAARWLRSRKEKKA